MGLEECGQFAATLRFRGAGAEAKDVTTTLWVRLSLFWPIAILFAAVVTGELIRRVRSNYLYGLQARADLAVLYERFKEALKASAATDEERAALTILRGQLFDLYQTVSRKPSADVSTLRTEVETKIRLVPRWLNARHRAAEAGWPADSQAKLRIVENLLRNPGQTNADPAVAALQAVEAILGDGPSLQDAIHKLDEAANLWSANSPASPSDKQAVLDAVAAAREHLAAGRLAETEDAFDIAATKLVRAAANELARLILQKDPPPGVIPAVWDELRDEASPLQLRGLPASRVHERRSRNTEELTLGICRSSLKA